MARLSTSNFLSGRPPVKKGKEDEISGNNLYQVSQQQVDSKRKNL